MTDFENKQKIKDNPDYFDPLQLYKFSKIDWDEFYEAKTVMSVRTSNNNKIINKMPFYDFTLNLKYLNKYIEAENKQQNGENTDNNSDAMKNVQKQANDIHKNAGNSFKNKIPKK